MGLGSAVAQALTDLSRHPWRSLLAAQGIVWAVALTIVPAAILEGSRRAAIDRAEELGTNRVEVSTDPNAHLAEMLQASDIPAIDAALETSARFAVLEVEPATGPDRVPRLWLLGTTRDIARTRPLRLVAGSFPVWCAPAPASAGGGGSSASVAPAAGSEIEAMLEPRLAQALFGAGSPIGARLWLLGTTSRHTIALADGALPAAGGAGDVPPAGARLLRVTGVATGAMPPGVNRFGTAQDALLGNAMRHLMELLGIPGGRPPWLEDELGIYLPRSELGGERLHWMFVECDPRSVGDVTKRLETLFAEHGRRLLISSNAVWRVIMQPELEQYLVLQKVIVGVLSGIGFLVMANMLLLAGRRRRREIALRCIEGATRGDVFRHFLALGVVLALGGCAAGVPAGMLLAWVRVAIDPNVLVTLAWPWSQILYSFVLFGTGAVVVAAGPAWAASRHEPMTILRRAAP